MDSGSNYCDRPTSLQEQWLYDHWLRCVEAEPPEALIARFRQLFIEGTSYPDMPVWRALEELLAANIAEREFRFILNRSCHILINRWLMQPRLHAAIPELINVFEAQPTRLARSWTSQRLRMLVQQFRQTDQYLTLQRLAKVISQPSEESVNSGSCLLGTLVYRYPYLYHHSLLTEDSTAEQRQKIRMIQFQAGQQFEIDLSYYITNQLRSSYQKATLGLGSEQGLDAGDVILQPGTRSVYNPTLLSDRSLDAALQQFGGKVEGSNTYRDLAQQFLTYSNQAPSYRVFKQELYDYLTANIDPRFGNRQFNPRLAECLASIAPNQDNQRPNDLLLTGTCRHLLNFLVVHSQQCPEHFVYSDLTANLGIPATIGLLLKVVLLCNQIKPYLEKRFAILFHHYESYARVGVNWLVESLEHLNVAFSLNFGKVKLA